MQLKHLSFLFLAALVSAAPAFTNLILHESRIGAPDGFVQTGPAPDEQMLNLRIALVNSDMAGLEDKLYAVSTPGSDLYGQHLSKEEVRTFRFISFYSLC